MSAAGDALRSAIARGWVDHPASDAATACSDAVSAGSAPPRRCVCTLYSCPSVNVPVLSTNKVCIRANPWIASSRRSSTPRRARAPAAASSADGAASDNAHGQVTISTDTTTQTARDGSTRLQTAPAAVASSNTAHRKGAAQRSALASMAGRWVRAARIKATIAS